MLSFCFIFFRRFQPGVVCKNMAYRKRSYSEIMKSNDFRHFVGNKLKGRISKRVFQENKPRQIFRKTNISYPLICTHVRCFLEILVLRFVLFPDTDDLCDNVCSKVSFLCFMKFVVLVLFRR